MPAVIYTETFAWSVPSGDALVTATVDDDAPGYPGQYLWNYHVENESFADGFGIFAVSVDDPAGISNLGNSIGWQGSVGELMGDPNLVSWMGGEFDPTIPIGQSADFWFTTLPTAVVLSSGGGFASDPGFATQVGGAVAAPHPAIVVNTTQDVVDANPAVTSLREAINEVNGPLHLAGQQRIKFADTLNGGTITLDPMQGQLPKIEKWVFIDGPVDWITIQRDPNTAVKHRIFEFGQSEGLTAPDLNTKLARLILQNGEANSSRGGAVSSSRNKLTVEDCAFFQNYALRGGGIYAESGSLTVTRGEFAENSATSLGGGAIYIGALVTTTISDSTFTLNSATDTDSGYGGAIYITSSPSAVPTTVTLSDVYLYENWAVKGGGAIYVVGAGGGAAGTTLTLRDTAIYDNWLTSNTGEGGGIYFGKGSLVLEDVVILNNTAPHGTNIFLVTGASIIDLPLYFTNIYTFEEGP